MAARTTRFPAGIPADVSRWLFPVGVSSGAPPFTAGEAPGWQPPGPGEMRNARVSEHSSCGSRNKAVARALSPGHRPQLSSTRMPQRPWGSPGTTPRSQCAAEDQARTRGSPRGTPRPQCVAEDRVQTRQGGSAGQQSTPSRAAPQPSCTSPEAHPESKHGAGLAGGRAKVPDMRSGHDLRPLGEVAMGADKEEEDDPGYDGQVLLCQPLPAVERLQAHCPVAASSAVLDNPSTCKTRSRFPDFPCGQIHSHWLTMEAQGAPRQHVRVPDFHLKPGGVSKLDTGLPQGQHRSRVQAEGAIHRTRTEGDLNAQTDVFGGEVRWPGRGDQSNVIRRRSGPAGTLGGGSPPTRSCQPPRGWPQPWSNLQAMENGTSRNLWIPHEPTQQKSALSPARSNGCASGLGDQSGTASAPLSGFQTHEPPGTLPINGGVMGGAQRQRLERSLSGDSEDNMSESALAAWEEEMLQFKASIAVQLPRRKLERRLSQDSNNGGTASRVLEKGMLKHAQQKHMDLKQQGVAMDRGIKKLQRSLMKDSPVGECTTRLLGTGDDEDTRLASDMRPPSVRSSKDEHSNPLPKQVLRGKKLQRSLSDDSLRDARVSPLSGTVGELRSHRPSATDNAQHESQGPIPRRKAKTRNRVQRIVVHSSRTMF